MELRTKRYPVKLFRRTRYDDPITGGSNVDFAWLFVYGGITNTSSNTEKAFNIVASVPLGCWDHLLHDLKERYPRLFKRLQPKYRDVNYTTINLDSKYLEQVCRLAKESKLNYGIIRFNVPDDKKQAVYFQVGNDLEGMIMPVITRGQ